MNGMRFVLLTSLVVGLLVGSAVGVGGETDSGDHPVIGPWVIENDALGFTTSLTIFHPEGSFSFTTETGTGIGAWEPTGEQTVDLTFFFPLADEEGEFFGLAIERGSVEVAASGETLTMTATEEFPTPDGGTTGQLAPESFSGTKIVVEPMAHTDDG